MLVPDVPFFCTICCERSLTFITFYHCTLVHFLVGMQALRVHKGTMIKCDECETTFTTDCAKKGTSGTSMVKKKTSNDHNVAIYPIQS